jgi:osmoprotectant transport system permease protein
MSVQSALVTPDLRRPARSGQRWKAFLVPGIVLLFGLVVWAWVQSLTLDSIEQRTLNAGYITDRVREHLVLSILAAVMVAVLAIPTGILVHRSNSRTLRTVVLGLANIGQATPAVGVVILLAIIWQTGFLTALIALVIYAFLPVLRNTLIGLAEVDPAVRESAMGMGMTPNQVLRRIELPLASPVILAGLRTALVFAVGVATIATFINAGGLGDMIVNGLKLQRFPVLLVGAGLVAAIAILIDWAAGLVEDRVKPKGL